MRNAFFKTIVDLAHSDERIVFLTGDLGFKLVDDFANRFPGRFYNMGVAEANMISVAAGLALSGKVPFVYSIVPFVTARCVEQIRNDLCNMRAPVIVVGVGGGYAYGENGPTHHGIDDIGLMRSLPGMTVVCPCDPQEVTDAMVALVNRGMPAYLRLGRAGEMALPRANGEYAFGRPTVIRDGHDVALIASGSVVSEALTAAKGLSGQGIDAAVLSLHTIKPIGDAIDFIVRKDYRLVIAIEEHGSCCGMAEALAARLATARNIRVEPVCAPDRFIHDVSDAAGLRRKAGLDADSILARVLDAMESASC